ncbi:PfkB family carbohydrate kinase [Oceanobacillus sp. CFH 90083]|uniref:PfkB family carbohydrate kinase n=1 Tax=Oceanobacillus sp. CFH 90083 TaxID=2592336 RepID=UPI00128AE191|nr:PfkB family carbohydrate kinase [Oceanobacillus sp. CFH 90083]
MKLITIGDNVVDCYLDRKEYFPGGNCVNVAVHAKRNGAEQVAYIGIFGNDAPARHLQFALTQEGIDYQFSRTAVGITGQPKVNLSPDGDRIFVGGPKNTVQHRFKIQLTLEEIEYVQQFDLCHVSCYSSMESELPKLAEVIKVAYDFSDHKTPAYIESVAPYISYAFFSAAELSEGDLEAFISSLQAFHFEVIVITRGGNPAIVISGQDRFYQKLNKIDVTDTMGAGDSFIAGFLTSYTANKNIEAAIEQGTRSAENTCQVYGGFGYPQPLLD